MATLLSGSERSGGFAGGVTPSYLSSPLMGARGAIGMTGGALSAGTDLIQRTNGLLIGSLNSIFHFAKSAATTTAGTIVGSSAAIVLAVHKISRATSDLGREADRLKNATGLSSGASMGVVNRFGAFGATAPNENPMMFGMRAGVYGLPGYDNPRFLESLAARFQSQSASGPMGHMMARGMMGSLGMDTPEMLRVANMPVAQIRERQGFGDRMQGALGLDSTTLVQVGRDWDMLGYKAKQAGSLVVAKLGVELMPRLTAGLDRGINLIEQRGGQIGDAIDRGSMAALSGATTLGRFLYADLPVYFLDATRTMLHGVGILADGVPSLFDSSLEMLSRVQGGFDATGSLIERTFQRLTQAGNDFVNSDLGKAIFAGVDVAKGYHQATDPARKLIQHGAQSAGANDNASALLGYGGMALAGRALWGGVKGMFGMGGAPGLAGGPMVPGIGPASFVPSWLPQGAMGAYGRVMATPAARLLTNPIAGRLGLGVAAGYGLYKGGQALGLIDREQSFGDRMQTGFGRLRDAVTGNWGHYDKTIQGNWAESRALDMAGASRPSTPPVMGSWAKTTDSVMGGAVRGGSGSIGNWARDMEAKISGEDLGSIGSRRADFDRMIQELRTQTSELKGIRQETSKANPNGYLRALGDIVAKSTAYLGVESFLAETRR